MAFVERSGSVGCGGRVQDTAAFVAIPKGRSGDRAQDWDIQMLQSVVEGGLEK